MIGFAQVVLALALLAFALFTVSTVQQWRAWFALGPMPLPMLAKVAFGRVRRLDRIGYVLLALAAAVTTWWCWQLPTRTGNHPGSDSGRDFVWGFYGAVAGSALSARLLPVLLPPHLRGSMVHASIHAASGILGLAFVGFFVFEVGALLVILASG
ncbi:MAG: hypothetical protein AB7O97_15215 [Planctomycetota bacterium]